MCPSLDEGGLVDRLATSSPYALRYDMETSEITDDLMGVSGTRPDVGWIDQMRWSTRRDPGRGSYPALKKPWTSGKGIVDGDGTSFT